MAFTSDPKSRGVIDLEKGYALHPLVRDIPEGEKWFSFLFEGTKITAKAKYSWPDRRKIALVFQVDHLENSVRHSIFHATPRYQPTPQEFRSGFLPALRDAVAAFIHRNIRHPDGRGTDVDVQFLDLNCKPMC
jgi:hypothetical protein